MMTPRFHRRSIRLRDYDYSASGAYFVTICTHQRECFLGDIVGESTQASEYGVIVQDTWHDLPKHYSNVQLDAFVLMPNYIHGIILLVDDVGAGFKPAPTNLSPLSEIVRAVKTFSARKINEMRCTSGISVWQRNYYEHVIRNEKSLKAIRDYIHANPANWALDRENPAYKPRQNMAN